MAALKYRGRHPKLRERLMRDLRRRPGQPCPQVVAGRVCGQPMWPDSQDIDLGHAPDGSYLGLTHARCNRQAGAIASNRGIVRKPLVLISGSGRKW